MPLYLLLLLALAVRFIRMLMRGLRVLVGLSGMLFALGVVIAAVLLRCIAVSLRRVFVMLGRLVVCVFWHDRFAFLSGEIRCSIERSYRVRNVRQKCSL